MRSYRIIDSYKEIPGSYYRHNIEIKDLKSNLYYSVWLDDFSAICFEHNPSNAKSIGYMKFLEEACIFISDDLIPYIYS